MHHASFILISISYEWHIICVNMHILLTKWCKNRKPDPFLFDIYQTDLYLLTVVFDKQLKIDGWFLVFINVNYSIHVTSSSIHSKLHVTPSQMWKVCMKNAETFLLMTLTNYIFDISTKFHWYHIHLYRVNLTYPW